MKLKDRLDGRWKNAVNMLNPLGSKGNMASAFATLLYQLWHGDVNYLAPYEFRVSTLCRAVLIVVAYVFRKKYVFLHHNSPEQSSMTRKSFFQSCWIAYMKI